MKPIIVPTINSNDTSAKVLRWNCPDGERVSAGQVVAVLETSKATFDLEAEADGFLRIGAEQGEMADYGMTIGVICADEAELSAAAGSAGGRSAAGAESSRDGAVKITRPAQELIDKHGITAEQVASLGRKIIRAADLAPLTGGAPAGGGEPLHARQAAIAKVTARSHASVPDAYLLKKVHCDAALEALISHSKKHGVMTGLAELIIHTVSRLPGQFPFFFGQLSGELLFTESKAADIGVTFDVGRGLYVPVIRNAAALSLEEIARAVMGFRMKAMRGTFKAEDLEGGDIAISLNMDRDTVLVAPIILAPQTCMISVGAVQREVVLDDAGNPAWQRYFHLGLAYDHRAINGFEANAFTMAVKSAIENVSLP